MRRTALLAALLLVPLAHAQQFTRIGPDPIEGLTITADVESIELLPNTSADVTFTLVSTRNDTLDLAIRTFEFSPSNRTLALHADVEGLTLGPGGNATVVVNVTALPDAPGGRERTFAFIADAPDLQRSLDKLTTVLFGGPPCESCPPDEEPQGRVVVGPGGSMDGRGGVVQRTPDGGMTTIRSGSDGSSGARDAPPADDAPPLEEADPYAETPGFAAWAVALAALAAIGRRRR